MAHPIGGTPSNSEASNIPKKVALISGATFLLLVLLLRLLPTQEQLKERMELLQKELRETKRLMNKCTE